MEAERELASVAPQRETFLTIGVFDGVHAGHRFLLDKLRQRAQENQSLTAVVTFTPHPRSVLQPQETLPYLSDLEDRVQCLRRIGIDLVVVLNFTPELAGLRAEEFISLLKRYLKMRGMVVGPDFALGRGREGNVDRLHSLGKKMAFTVEVVPPLAIDGEIVSSTLIRQALSQGNVQKVRKLMGRYFHLEGRVITSDKRGRALGFPTANVDVRPQQALPANGIYATITHVDGRRFPSATNIGIRPTFGEGKRLVESHLIDYTGNLYDKKIRVEFVQKLRDEQSFPSVEALKAQIGRDVEQAKIVLARELHEQVSV